MKSHFKFKFSFLIAAILLFQGDLVFSKNQRVTPPKVVKIGFGCEHFIEAAHQTTLPSGHIALIETPRLILSTPYGPIRRGRNPEGVLAIEKETSLKVGSITISNLGGHLPLNFVPFAQGLGFATEAKFALMKYVFDFLGVPEMIAVIENRNIASIRLQTKLGFIRCVEADNDPQEYKVTKAGFRLVEKQVAREFGGDLVAFSKPTRPRTLVQQLAYDYVSIVSKADSQQPSELEEDLIRLISRQDFSVHRQIFNMLINRRAFGERLFRYLQLLDDTYEPLLSQEDVFIETPRLILKRSETGLDILVYEKSSKLEVGSMGFHRQGEWLPIFFNPFAHGLGYATESRFALMQYIFNETEVEVIDADIQPNNIASLNLNKKLGFVQFINSQGMPTRRHEITKLQFRALELRLQREFNGDVRLFAKPSRKRPREIELAHEYAQIVVKSELEDISDNEFGWLFDLLLEDISFQKDVVDVLPRWLRRRLLYVAYKSGYLHVPLKDTELVSYLESSLATKEQRERRESSQQ